MLIYLSSLSSDLGEEFTSTARCPGASVSDLGERADLIGFHKSLKKMGQHNKHRDICDIVPYEHLAMSI
jgi:hypothetical protein